MSSTTASTGDVNSSAAVVTTTALPTVTTGGGGGNVGGSLGTNGTASSVSVPASKLVKSTPVSATSAASVDSNSVQITIEDLYKYFGILADAKQQAGEHVDTYLKIISGTKGGTKEKQLASQFITRFFKYFPKEMPIAIDAIFDLCEDEDVTIRKAAIKDLAVLCKDCKPEHLNRIADILTQLLQTDDQNEFSQVQTSLLTAFKQNPKSTLAEIFNQITTAELEEVRKRAIKFLVAKVPGLFSAQTDTSATNLFNKELEDLIVKHVKQVLVDVDAEEFILFIRLLTSLPSMNTLTGRQDLVNIIMAQSELDKPFEANVLERIMILLSCIQQAIPLFSKNVQSTRYVSNYIKNVLTVFGSVNDDNLKFEILKSLADLCIHYNCTSSQQMYACTTSDLNVLYNLLIEYLPKPIENLAGEVGNGGTEKTVVVDVEAEKQEDKFNFSYVECLLYAFHHLVKFNTEYLTSEENKERLKEFRIRLQYFAKGTQNYIKELRNTLLNSSINANAANKENEENKIRRVALKVTTNIDMLIKDFFHNPPAYKSLITLSWKSTEQRQQAADLAQATKRSLSVSSLDGNEAADGGNQFKKKPERGIYHPPSGKYSVTNSNGNGSVTNNNNNNNNNKRRTYSHEQNQRGGLANRNGRY